MPLRLPDSLADLHSYVPGKPIEEVQREFGLPEVVKLASNENPLGPSPLAIKAIAESAQFAHLYPDVGCVELKSALSEHIGMPTTQIAVGNGSDEFIHLISLLLLKPSDSIVMADPGFSRYESEAIVAGAETRKVPLDSEARHDLRSMANAIDKSTRVVWLANPNNPTGTIVRRNQLEDFLDRTPDDIAIVLDEAYFEFAIDPDYPNSIDYISERTNVIGLRTFSKTYGLAGIRIGYAIASSEVVSALEKLRAPFSVNSIAQRAAIAALGDAEHLQRTIKTNSEGISRLTEFMKVKGCKVAESFANFVWCDIGCPADPISQALLRRGIIVRPGSIFGCPNHLRVSIGTDDQMSKFETQFSQVYGETVAV
jgi:histidinol-phosphate aminotransferase